MKGIIWLLLIAESLMIPFANESANYTYSDNSVYSGNMVIDNEGDEPYRSGIG